MTAEKGWYSLPSDPSKLMYFDGSNFVGEPVDAPPAQKPKAAWMDDAIGKAKDFASDKENQGTAMAIGGAAALVDGTVGLGNRSGIFSVSVSSILGVGLIVAGLAVGLLMSGGFDDKEPRAGEVESSATVVDMEYEMRDNGETGRDRDFTEYCIPFIESASGETIRLAGSILTYPCNYSIGESVRVFVKPDVPGSERLVPGSKTGIAHVILPSAVLIGTGIIFFLVGVGPMLKKLVSIAGGATLLGMGLSRRSQARKEKRERAENDPNRQ